jgi:thiamine-phosphate pyrophosphorylase
MALPRIYPIVESAEWVRRLLPLGVRLVQLRVKDRPLAEVRAQIIESKGLCTRAGAQLIVNDYWQLALDEGCNFVHLGQGDLDTADIAALRKAGVRIGVSTHDHAELGRALSLDPDYVALGPIYPTLLKVMPWAPQGLDRLTEWKRRVGRIPLVAIGGLTAERLHGVFAAGADVAAVVTDIVRNPDPEARTKEWLEAAARESPLATNGERPGAAIPKRATAAGP